MTQPWPPGPNSSRRDQLIYYQYWADRARGAMAGIDQQIAKGERAVAGKVPAKRNRFIKLPGDDKSVNRELEAKTRTLTGWKSYITNITSPTPEFVIGAYHQLWHIEKSFRMSKHDLKARPIYHHKRQSIDAHLAVVFAALAVTHLIERRTGWWIKKVVRTAPRYRTVDSFGRGARQHRQGVTGTPRRGGSRVTQYRSDICRSRTSNRASVSGATTRCTCRSMSVNPTGTCPSMAKQPQQSTRQIASMPR